MRITIFKRKFAVWFVLIALLSIGASVAAAGALLSSSKPPLDVGDFEGY